MLFTVKKRNNQENYKIVGHKSMKIFQKKRSKYNEKKYEIRGEQQIRKENLYFLNEIKF